MLQIQNIKKKFVTGDLTQVALDGVSLNLRDNEFVAVLGPYKAVFRFFQLYKSSAGLTDTTAAI